MTYNEIMQKAGKQIMPRVYYDNYEITDDIEATLFFNTSLTGTVMTGIELELKEELPKNTAIYFENNATYNNYSKTKTYGPYYLREVSYNADSKTYSHNLYDEFLKTMVDYKTITISYPTTVYEFFLQLVAELGFTTDILSLPNGTRTLANDVYSDINYTYRDVLDDIGGATASLFKVENGKITRCELGTTTIKIDDDILKNQNIEMGEHFGPINSIVLARSADSDKIYKRDETLTEWNEFKISDNQLMNNNDREDYLDEIYNTLYGIEYDLFDLELVGYGGFEPLQKVQIETIENGITKVFNSYIFNNEQKFTQGYEESIYTELPEESETDYRTSDTTDKRLNQAFIIVDKQNNRITSVVSEIEKVDSKATDAKNTADSNYNKLIGKLSDYATTESVTSQISTVNDTITANSRQISVINETLENGVTKVKTENDYTFNKNGLDITSSNTNIHNTLNENGMTIRDKDETLLFAGYDEDTKESLVLARNIRIEKYLTSPYERKEAYNNPEHGWGSGAFDIE